MSKSLSTALFSATLAAAALAAVATPAAAQAVELTRAEVQAELVRAQVAGELVYWNDGVQFSLGRDAGAAKPRAEVVAELEAARASGELLRSQRENYEPPTPVGIAKTRAEVLAELVIYRDSGLADADRPDGLGLDDNSRAKAQVRYAQLKASPTYAMLVDRFGSKDHKGAVTEAIAAR